MSTAVAKRLVMTLQNLLVIHRRLRESSDAKVVSVFVTVAVFVMFRRVGHELSYIVITERCCLKLSLRDNIWALEQNFLISGRAIPDKTIQSPYFVWVVAIVLQANSNRQVSDLDILNRYSQKLRLPVRVTKTAYCYHVVGK
jgi:hypothetical protein